MPLQQVVGRPQTPKLSIVKGPTSPKCIKWTFNDLLHQRCKQDGDKICVISEHQSRQLTYAALRRRSQALAASLSKLGVGRGDRVAVLLGNRLEYVEIFFACSFIGAYFTLLNYAYSSSDALHALQMTMPKALFAIQNSPTYDYGRLLNDVHRKVAGLDAIIILDDTSATAQPPTAHIDGYLRYEEMLLQGQGRERLVAELSSHVKCVDVLNLQFTSGSTGRPKAAALTHYGMINSARYIAFQMGISPKDRIAVPVPLFHAFGLIIGLCTALFGGGSIVLPSDRFNIEATLLAVEKYECTGIYGVTTMFIDELAHPTFAARKLSSLRFGLVAGSAIPEELLRQIMARFPLSEVFTNWGMTELSSIVTMTSATDSVEKKLRTAGRLLPSFTAKIVDPQTLQTLPWGQRGEIMVSGFGVMHSYYNDPLQSAKTIHVSPSNVTCGGDEPTTRWLRTGDEGYLDHEGYFVITGRIKELIIRGGENISPLEIEARLFEHPAVKQVAVFGVSSHRYGEEVAAMLESQGSGLVRPSTTEIQSWVSAALSRYKVPKYIWWLGDKDLGLPDVWPKTANGKLRKSEIRSLGEALLKRECFDQATHLKGKL